MREGVGVWPSRTRRILGRLSLVKQHAVLFLAWLPYSIAPPPAAAAVAAAAAEAAAAAAAAAQHKNTAAAI